MPLRAFYQSPTSFPTGDSSKCVNDSRRAPWLLSDYTSPIWVVIDLDDPDHPVTIDFRYRLADGRYLTEVDSLYRTIKEYAWWLRDPAIGGLHAADTQRNKVWGLMAVAHALTLQGLWSFADVDPHVARGISTSAAYGVDGLLQAHTRLGRYLDDLESRHAQNPMPDRGLPRYETLHGIATDRIASSEVLKECRLPSGISRMPRVAWLMRLAAVRASLRHGVEVSVDCPEPSLLTSIAMLRFLSPLEELYDWRHRIKADCPPVKPFDSGALQVCDVLGRKTRRVPTPPPRQALALLESAATWVVDYGPQLLEVAEKMQSFRELPDNQRNKNLAGLERILPSMGPEGGPWPCCLRMFTSAKAFHFHDAIKYLSAACWVVIATFTARRAKELSKLTANAVQGSERDGWWLHVHIAKTLRRKEWIPVPSIVVQAIRVMEAISGRARELSGDERLFQWLNPFTRQDGVAAMALQPGRYLDAFAAHVSVPKVVAKDKTERDWHWTTHQLRRFFAILYFYRYEGATLEVLSHHLRHFNLEMTRVYVTRDPDVLALWLDAEWGYQGDLVRAIVMDERRVLGGAAARISKAARRIAGVLRRQLKIITPARIADAVQQLLRRRGVVLSAKPWVTCTCPATSKAAVSAQCRRGAVDSNAVGPDFAAAGPDVCASCPWAYIDESRFPYFRGELSNLRLRDDQDEPGTIVAQLALARIARLESVELQMPDHQPAEAPR